MGGVAMQRCCTISRMKSDYGGLCLAAVLMVALLFAGTVQAADDCTGENGAASNGEESGVRNRLCDKGVTLAFTHKSDFLAGISGGAARGAVVVMNSEAAVGMDLDKFAGWGDTSAFIQYHVQHGNKSINNYTGSFAGVTNIETGFSTGQFYQAWLQKNFAADKFSLLAGLYAIDSEFHVTDASHLFLQPPYGMSAEMAQTGPNGPPVFPMGALGVRVKYSGENLYLQGALTDGVPGNPNDRHGTHIRLGNGDGTLAVLEFGRAPQRNAGEGIDKIAVGLWRYTARAADLTEVDAAGNPLRRRDHGIYLLAERTLMSRADGRQLSGFARFGMVNKDVYQSDWSGSAGVAWQGLFDGRGDDAAGLAVNVSHASAKYRTLNGAKLYEAVLELTYRAQLQPWLAVQPVVQYFRNPNMDPALRDAWVVGARVEIGL